VVNEFPTGLRAQISLPHQPHTVTLETVGRMCLHHIQETRPYQRMKLSCVENMGRIV